MHRHLTIAVLVVAFGCGDEKGDDSNCEAQRGGIPDDSGFPPDDSGLPPDDSGTPPPDDGGDPSDDGGSEGAGDDGDPMAEACPSMADDGADGGASMDDGADSADDGADSADDGGESPSMDDGGSLGGLGDPCSNGDQCEGGKCILSQGDSGFCTRTCTSADDCPESGWACNLAPYTACVPE